MTHEVYTYGIVRGGHRLPPSATGVGSPPEPLRVLDAGPLSAVVSRAPTGLLARRRDILAHQRTLLALAHEGPVVPMRFGSVAPDEATLRDRLSGHAEDTLRTLDRLDGRVEMNLKAVVIEDDLPTLLHDDAHLRRLHRESRTRPGYEASIRLGQAVAEALARRASAAATRTVHRVRALTESTAPGPTVEGCVLNLSFLLPRDNESAFRAAVDRSAAEHIGQVELRLSGPLPCFSFTETRPAPPGGTGLGRTRPTRAPAAGAGAARRS